VSDVEIVRNDEAMALLRSIDDPITERLVNNALYHFLRRVHERKELPAADFDLLYFLELMRDVFSEHDVLKGMLAGENVGAFFFDDER
jgi:hypothetical protein